MRYCLPLKKKRSVPTNCHWYSGNFVGIKGSNLRVKLFEHSSHLLTLSAIFFDKPGHHTASLALNWHLSMPWWPWYIFSSTWFCIPVGTTIRLLYSNSVFPTVNLAWCSQYYYLGHPDSQYYSRASFCFFQYSSNLSSPAVSYDCSHHFFSLHVFLSSSCLQWCSWQSIWYIQSFLCSIEYWDLVNRNRNLKIFGANLWAVWILIRGLWSVCMRNGCPRT